MKGGIEEKLPEEVWMFIFQFKQLAFFTNSDNSTIFIICSYIRTGGRKQQLLHKNVFS